MHALNAGCWRENKFKIYPGRHRNALLFGWRNYRMGSSAHSTSAAHAPPVSQDKATSTSIEQSVLQH